MTAAISVLGGSGFILIMIKFFKFIKDQYTQNIYAGLILILAVMIFVIILSIFVIKPIVIDIIEWRHLNIMHEREFNNVNNIKTPVRANMNKIIKVNMDDMIRRNHKHINNDEEIKKIIDKFVELKEKE